MTTATLTKPLQLEQQVRTCHGHTGTVTGLTIHADGTKQFLVRTSAGPARYDEAELAPID